jgi:hypothetical protein
MHRSARRRPVVSLRSTTGYRLSSLRLGGKLRRVFHDQLSLHFGEREVATKDWWPARGHIGARTVEHTQSLAATK